MSRRGTIRISLGTNGSLTGARGSLACTVLELSAGGARLAIRGRLPGPPFTLTLTLGGEQLELAVAVQRLRADAGIVAVRFEGPAPDSLHHLIAREQQRAQAAGRLNVVERRAPRAPARGVRGEVI